jgi:3-hydroxyisobutyrate dehydrogenase
MKIGFIGLGLMGRGMAANLQKSVHDLAVHDLRREAAAPLLEMRAAWTDTLKALAKASEVIFTSLPKPADVEAVAGSEAGLGAGFRPGAVWFDLS